jgi:chromosome segregation ATPase
MSKLSEFLLRGQPSVVAGGAPRFDATPAQFDDVNRPTPVSVLEPLDDEETSEAGANIGKENEALRQLLVDANQKLSELDDFKKAFSVIIDPAHRILQELEEEKSSNIGLRRLLEQTRVAYEKQQEETKVFDRNARALAGEIDKLRQELDISRDSIRTLEGIKLELASDLASKNTRLVHLEAQLSQVTAIAEAAGEKNQLLTTRVNESERKVGELETDIRILRDESVLLTEETRSLKASLGQTVAEASVTANLLNESETALAGARVRIAQLETVSEENKTERARLQIALDEANEKLRIGSTEMNIHVTALHGRAATTEKLLTEVRQTLAVRTEEARVADRQAMEATFARNRAEKKLAELDNMLKAQEVQIRELEQTRTTLIERSAAVVHALKIKDTQLARAEERILQMTDRVGQDESLLQSSRQTLEKRIQELDSELERERIDHSVAKGSLEAARKDREHLQRELTKLKSALRRAGVSLEDEFEMPKGEPTPANEGSMRGAA